VSRARHSHIVRGSWRGATPTSNDAGSEVVCASNSSFLFGDIYYSSWLLACTSTSNIAGSEVVGTSDIFIELK